MTLAISRLYLRYHWVACLPWSVAIFAISRSCGKLQCTLSCRVELCDWNSTQNVEVWGRIRSLSRIYRDFRMADRIFTPTSRL